MRTHRTRNWKWDIGLSHTISRRMLLTTAFMSRLYAGKVFRPISAIHYVTCPYNIISELWHGLLVSSEWICIQLSDILRMRDIHPSRMVDLFYFGCWSTGISCPGPDHVTVHSAHTWVNTNTQWMCRRFSLHLLNQFAFIVCEVIFRKNVKASRLVRLCTIDAPVLLSPNVLTCQCLIYS